MQKHQDVDRFNVNDIMYADWIFVNIICQLLVQLTVYLMKGIPIGICARKHVFSDL